MSNPMKSQFFHLVLLLICGLQVANARPEIRTVSFKSGDGLEITADLNLGHDKTAPFIILFHQAGWSRGEYKEIAPKLTRMGFNTLAVDQRSGDKVNGVSNETHARAVKADKATGYLDALQDLVAALKFAKKNYSEGKLIVWGSSYSAALVIKLAADHGNLIDGVLSFSPGEYFKGKLSVTKAAAQVTCPVFITSAKSETGSWQGFFAKLPEKSRQSFVPETKGNHGSRALWEKFEDNNAYWIAVSAFLKHFHEVE